MPVMEMYWSISALLTSGGEMQEDLPLSNARSLFSRPARNFMPCLPLLICVVLTVSLLQDYRCE